MVLNTNRVEFVRSAAASKQFIQSSVPVVAFAGKSNVGKSSVINRLLNRKNLARVSGEPGKTIHVNYFIVDNKVYFADLPGYGYAKVSQSEKERWGRLMESFFQGPEPFQLGIFIVDSRHKPTADDVNMAEFFKSSGLPFVVLANKIDKLKKSEIQGNIDLIRQTLNVDEEVAIIPFSAEKGTGRDDVLRIIQQII